MALDELFCHFLSLLFMLNWGRVYVANTQIQGIWMSQTITVYGSLKKTGGDPKWRSYTFPVPVDGRSSASVAHISRWEDLWGVWESVDLSQVWNNSVPGWEMPVPWQVTQGLEAWLHVFPLVPRRKSQNVTPHFCESLGLFCLNKVKVLRAKSLSPLPWMI